MLCADNGSIRHNRRDGHARTALPRDPEKREYVFVANASLSMKIRRLSDAGSNDVSMTSGALADKSERGHSCGLDQIGHRPLSKFARCDRIKPLAESITRAEDQPSPCFWRNNDGRKSPVESLRRLWRAVGQANGAVRSVLRAVLWAAESFSKSG